MFTGNGSGDVLAEDDIIDHRLVGGATRLVSAYVLSVLVLVGAILLSYTILRDLIENQQNLSHLKTQVSGISLSLNDSVNVMSDYHHELQRRNLNPRLLQLIKARVQSSLNELTELETLLLQSASSLESSDSWSEIQWITDASEFGLHWKLRSYLEQLALVLAAPDGGRGRSRLIIPVDAAGARDGALSQGYLEASNQLSTIIQSHSTRVNSVHLILTWLVVVSMILLSVFVVIPLWIKVMREHARLQQTHEKLRQVAFTDRDTTLPNLNGLEREILPQHLAKYPITELHLLLIRISNTDELYNLVGSFRITALHKLFAERLTNLDLDIDQWSRSSDSEYSCIIHEKTFKRSGEWACSAFNSLSEPLNVEGIVVRPVLTMATSQLEPTPDSRLELIEEQGNNVLWEHQSRARMTSLLFDRSTSELPVYEQTLKDELSRQNELITSISLGIENREFIPYYQVKVDANTGLPCSLEVLCRWQKPDGSLVPPFEFIPVAESSGQIVALTYQLFDQVVEDIHDWCKQGIAVGRVAINIAADVLHHPQFLEKVKQLEQSLPEQCAGLELEITENIALGDDFDAINAILTEIRTLGVLVAIDDFGTGYASLQSLISLPFDVLKIDRSFVLPIQEDGSGGEVISAIVSLSNNLHKCCVVEGVEYEWQWKLLASLGAHELQGFHFHKPSSAESTRDWLLEAQHYKLAS